MPASPRKFKRLRVDLTVNRFKYLARRYWQKWQPLATHTKQRWKQRSPKHTIHRIQEAEVLSYLFIRSKKHKFAQWANEYDLQIKGEKQKENRCSKNETTKSQRAGFGSSTLSASVKLDFLLDKGASEREEKKRATYSAEFSADGSTKFTTKTFSFSRQRGGKSTHKESEASWSANPQLALPKHGG